MKKHNIFLILIVFSLFVAGCKYDFVMPEAVPAYTNVSFSGQVAPIFSTDNKCTECHSTGAQAPDLSAANAFAQLMSKYVNTASPEASIILTEPGSSTHSWKKLTAGEAGLILAWIKEGANDN